MQLILVSFNDDLLCFASTNDVLCSVDDLHIGQYHTVFLYLGGALHADTNIAAHIITVTVYYRVLDE